MILADVQKELENILSLFVLKHQPLDSKHFYYPVKEYIVRGVKTPTSFDVLLRLRNMLKTHNHCSEELIRWVDIMLTLSKNNYYPKLDSGYVIRNIDTFELYSTNGNKPFSLFPKVEYADNILKRTVMRRQVGSPAEYKPKIFCENHYKEFVEFKPLK